MLKLLRVYPTFFIKRNFHLAATFSKPCAICEQIIQTDNTYRMPIAEMTTSFLFYFEYNGFIVMNKYGADLQLFSFLFQVVSHDSHSLLAAHYRLESQPLISSLHEVIVGNRYLYLVFPKAYGDLHSYVRSRKRLRESEARKLFKQIVDTVKVCHKSGIVLRDLKLRKFVFADPQR